MLLSHSYFRMKFRTQTILETTLLKVKQMPNNLAENMLKHEYISSIFDQQKNVFSHLCFALHAYREKPCHCIYYRTRIHIKLTFPFLTAPLRAAITKNSKLGSNHRSSIQFSHLSRVGIIACSETFFACFLTY